MTDKLQRFSQPTAPFQAVETNGTNTPPCKGCGSTEPPDAGGQCPTTNCRKTRCGNKKAARLRPSDIATAEDLFGKLVAERPGTLDTVSLVRLRDFSTAVVQLQRVSERLDEVGPLTAAGRQRSLLAVYSTFSARVERLGADIALTGGAADDLVKRLNVGIPSMPSPMLRLAHTLVSRSITGEPLTERELGQLDILRSAMRGDVTLSAEVKPELTEQAHRESDSNKSDQLIEGEHE